MGVQKGSTVHREVEVTLRGEVGTNTIITENMTERFVGCNILYSMKMQEAGKERKHKKKHECIGM